MKHLLPAIALVAFAMAACVKEDTVADLVSNGSCGTDGARMEATVGGADWCASGTVVANGSGTSAIITGISLTGGTLVLEVDSIGLGDQVITEADNGVLFTSIEGSYTVPQNGHGTLTISSFDPTNGRLKGSLDIGLRLNGEGLAKQVLGSFDVTLTGE